MLKESVTVKDVCNLLNEALGLDKDCIEKLINFRVKCNSGISSHEAIQVRQLSDGCALGLLGLLNGMFGIREDGMGPICMMVEDDGSITEFKETSLEV